MKFETKDTPQGRIKYHVWTEEIRDEDTGEVFTMERRRPVELNGKPLRFYSSAEIRGMSKRERIEAFGDFTKSNLQTARR
ncbi:MAG: hypothetical protein ACOYXB_00605 [Bacteroidota bacterium]